MPGDARLETFDLNLLRTLDVVLELRHITRAAQRLGVTQPALSRSLARARRELSDALLVRGSTGLVLTPRAEALRGPLRTALEAVSAVLAPQPPFDPLTSRRRFTVSTVDSLAATLSARLTPHLAREAPMVTMRVLPQQDEWDAALQQGSLDGVVLPKRHASPGVVWSQLFADERVCIVNVDHPRVRARLSLRDFCDERHVVVLPSNEPSSVVDRWLERRGLSRVVALQVTSFLVAAQVVASSELLAVVPRSVVSADPRLRAVASPVPLPPLSVALAWHERARTDPGHRWWRRMLAARATQA